MKQEIIKSELINENYSFYKHESGLGILLYPMKSFSTTYAVFATNYGSVDTTFKTDSDNEFITVPEGVAHFLEHKMFESESGVDVFELYAKTGASANAATSFDKTSYLFSTAENFQESLEILLDFVQEPYFTEKTVEKEQGIIGQEIKMYDDDPNWRVLFNLLGCLYHENPVKIDIAGTTETISKINKDILYRCYNTFYNLNNMVLCIAGNFDEQETIKTINAHLKENKKIVVEKKVPSEPDTIVKAEYIQNLPVAKPLFNIGFKENIAEAEQTRYSIICDIILTIISGKGSKLYKELYDERLISPSFSAEVFSGRGFFVNIFDGESDNPKLVADKIINEIENLKTNGISVDDFERVKKSQYGRTIMSFNDTEEVAFNLVGSYFDNRSAYDELDVISNLTLKDVNDVLRSTFNKDKMAISIIKSK